VDGDCAVRFFFGGFGSDRVRITDRAGSREKKKLFVSRVYLSKLQATNPRPRANAHGTTLCNAPSGVCGTLAGVICARARANYTTEG